MECLLHKKREAKGICSECKQNTCEICTIKIGDSVFCREHARKLIKNQLSKQDSTKYDTKYILSNNSGIVKPYVAEKKSMAMTSEEDVKSIGADQTFPLYGLFTNFVDNGGPVLTSVHVHLIFWGKSWAAVPQPSPNAIQVKTAIANILSSPYMRSLSQYREIGMGTLTGTTIVDADPPNPFTMNDIVKFIVRLIDDGALPHPHDDKQLLYCIIMPVGISSDDGNALGEHSFFTYSQYFFPFDYEHDNAHFAWILNDGTIDRLTVIFSHELVEACTDPELNAIVGEPGTCTVGQVWDGRPFWVGNFITFRNIGKTQIVFYNPDGMHWWTGLFDHLGFMDWSYAGNTAGFGQVWDGLHHFWTGDFGGIGNTQILFYYQEDKNWWLGTFDKNNDLTWNLADNTERFGQVWDGLHHFWTGDFKGIGNTQILFYYQEDKNWWLGTFDKTGNLTWNLADNTERFDQVYDGRPFWVGDFKGIGSTQILFYAPIDKNWWLGTFDKTGNLTWNLADNTERFGQVWDGLHHFWTGDFKCIGNTQILFYFQNDLNWWVGTFDKTGHLHWTLSGNTGPLNICEIGDVCGKFTAKINGVMVQSYWSQIDQACIIPT